MRNLDTSANPSREAPAGFTARQAFTTAGLAISETRAAWLRYLREVYFTLDVDTGHADVVEGRLVKRGFDQLEASEYHSGRQRIVRSLDSVVADRVETFCVAFPGSGEFTCRQRGRETVAAPGTVYIVNASEPYQVDIAEGSGLVCLSVPCDLLRERVRGIEDLCGQGNFADPVMVSTLRHLLEQALVGEPATDAARLQDLCLDMIELMVRPGLRRSSHAEAVAGDLFHRAQRVLRERCLQTGFDLAAAATECGASPRRVQAAMTRQGTTFGRELIAARLQEASRLLKSPSDAARQVGEVAAACGFSSQAHFSTRYREYFGRSPSDERRRDDGGTSGAPKQENGAPTQDACGAVG